MATLRSVPSCHLFAGSRNEQRLSSTWRSSEHPLHGVRLESRNVRLRLAFPSRLAKECHRWRHGVQSRSGPRIGVTVCRGAEPEDASSDLRGAPPSTVGRPKKFRSGVLQLTKWSISFNDAAQAFFKSEIRRRICVTVLLLMASRVGYFIPLPGFDRRFMPGNYLGFVLGTTEEVGELVPELKLSLFQLGISPYIFASIVMQLGCNMVPALIKIRKEGIDGNERIQRYVWWLSLAVAVVEAIVLAFHSASYSIYAAKNKFGYVTVTTGLLAAGAMAMHAICEKTTEAGFGHGSSLIICVGILTGYSDTLFNIISNLSRGGASWGPQILLFVAIFLVMTMWAVLVTEGRRKVKLQYYNFELAPTSSGAEFLYRLGVATPEVEPYIPFNLNPGGMQPVLATTYLMALPGILAAFTRNPFWVRLTELLNPALPPAPGAQPWIYYSLSIFFIFVFNVLDISDTPKEIANYMLKIGARIPKVKPGRQTIEYLNKVQASTRFWGGLLLGLLVTVSTLVDFKFRSLSNTGGSAIGFTSMLIIVGSIIELRRSFAAYNVMPALTKVLRRYGA